MCNITNKKQIETAISHLLLSEHAHIKVNKIREMNFAAKSISPPSNQTPYTLQAV